MYAALTLTFSKLIYFAQTVASWHDGEFQATRSSNANWAHTKLARVLREKLSVSRVCSLEYQQIAVLLKKKIMLAWIKQH